MPAGPMFGACGPALPCAAPAVCQMSVCLPPPVAAPPAVFAAPVPVPVPVAHLPPPPPMPAYIPVAPAPAPIVYAPPPPPPPMPVAFAAPVPVAPLPPVSGLDRVLAKFRELRSILTIRNRIPVAPAPVVAGRLIPQALPGAPCEPGVECTGGSVCSLGVCLCPPELIQEGTVCVTRTVYGVVAPPPPPPPPIVVAPMIPAVPVAVGAACAPPLVAAPAPCVQGAVCAPAGVCQCGPAFTPYANGCIRRSVYMPLFSRCNPILLCEQSLVCKYGICFPDTKPVELIVKAIKKPLVIYPNVRNITKIPIEPVTSTTTSAPRPTSEATPLPVVPTSFPISPSELRPLPYTPLVPLIAITAKPVIPPTSSPLPTPPSPSPEPSPLPTPKALPGQPCAIPNTECTAGSICDHQRGVCVCEPNLIHEGNVCVANVPQTYYAYQYVNSINPMAVLSYPSNAYR
ncbi:hypothetical protein WR25_25506 [Diploscapter pachys]|uniref:EB domain-containing protein n=1 Tax=Diploscapter pachys TaxID=2018661 RepID=A0A2A2LD84_9BILA|nr:hypothetical protein WR25_25506 [Diploscapter pachys]